VGGMIRWSGGEFGEEVGEIRDDSNVGPGYGTPDRCDARSGTHRSKKLSRVSMNRCSISTRIGSKVPTRPVDALGNGYDTWKMK
jgi:hypothetical protein